MSLHSIVQIGTAYPWLELCYIQRMWYNLYPPLLHLSMRASRFLAAWSCIPAACLTAQLIKAGDVELSPRATTQLERERCTACDVCNKNYIPRKQTSIRHNRRVESVFRSSGTTLDRST